MIKKVIDLLEVVRQKGVATEEDMIALHKAIKEYNGTLDEIELNPFADASRANNGGGYHQPAYYAGNYWYEDTSCGEFGRRLSWEIEVPDGTYRYNDYAMNGEYEEILEYTPKGDCFGVTLYEE